MDAACLNRVHTFWRQTVECGWEWRRVPVLGKVAEV